MSENLWIFIINSSGDHILCLSCFARQYGNCINIMCWRKRERNNGGIIACQNHHPGRFTCFFLISLQQKNILYYLELANGFFLGFFRANTNIIHIESGFKFLLSFSHKNNQLQINSVVTVLLFQRMRCIDCLLIFKYLREKKTRKDIRREMVDLKKRYTSIWISQPIKFRWAAVDRLKRLTTNAKWKWKMKSVLNVGQIHIWYSLFECWEFFCLCARFDDKTHFERAKHFFFRIHFYGIIPAMVHVNDLYVFVCVCAFTWLINVFNLPT